jgi:hypothetical protein
MLVINTFVCLPPSVRWRPWASTQLDARRNLPSDVRATRSTPSVRTPFIVRSRTGSQPVKDSQTAVTYVQCSHPARRESRRVKKAFTHLTRRG